MDLIDKLQQAFPIHYRKGDILLMQADCMEVMKFIPDKAIDLAIVDPPYGINFAKTHTGKGWIVREQKQWDKSTPDKNYFFNLYRAAKNQIIWGANYMTPFLPASQHWIFWDKGQRNFSLADGELAFTSFDKALRVFEMSRGSMQSEQGGEIKFHPTQKPVKLYKWLLTNYAKPDQLIFDSHTCKGEGLNQIITPSCVCGWKGKGEPVYEDWYPTNISNQIEKHLKEVDAKEI